MKLLHISDLHFHRDPQDNRAAEALLATVQRQYPNHTLIVTGDISDDGTEWQFQNALQALTPFQGRIFIAPGNHDFGAMGNFYSDERARRFDQMLSVPLQQGGTFTGDSTPVVNFVRDGTDTAMLIALDTNLETHDPFDFACGEVGPAQLAALNTILCDPANAQYTKVVFFHHHLFLHNDPFMELRDGRELKRALYGKADVVLFGHKHAFGQWHSAGGMQLILASDSSPETQRAREIEIKGKQVTATEVSLKPGGKKKAGK